MKHDSGNIIDNLTVENDATAVRFIRTVGTSADYLKADGSISGAITLASLGLTGTAAEYNVLDLSGLTVGWVLSADSVNTASWKAPTGGGGSGTVTSVTAGTGMTQTGVSTVNPTLNVIGTSGRITASANAIDLSTAGPGAASYGSTANGTKIDTITLDAYGRVTAIATGATGIGSSSFTGWDLYADGVLKSAISTSGENVNFAAGTNMDSVVYTATNNTMTFNASTQGGGGGSVTDVIAGNGMDFVTITGSGSATMGTPSSLTAATTNALTATSHTHAITGFSETGHTHTISTGATDLTGTAGEYNVLDIGAKTVGYVLTIAAGGATAAWELASGGTDTFHDTWSWTDGGAAGPTASITGTAATITVAAIPAAAFAASGIITTETQTLSGLKTFSNNVTAPDFIGSSDARLKENTEVYKPKKINSVYKTGNFIGDPQERIFVIAQELEIEHPDFVRTNEKGFKSVSYSDLHSAEIAHLKSEVTELRAIIEKII